jgi:hypothetical protein
MTQGEKTNTWGDITSDNLDKIEESIAGRKPIALASADYTLTTNNGGAGSAEEAVAMFLDCTGILTANVNIIAPNTSKMYVVRNGTTGSFTVGIKTTSGTALEIPQGETYVVWCNGTNVFRTVNALISGAVAEATNALQLGGVVAASYAQLALKNSWLNPQVVTGNDITLTAGTYTPNADTDTTMFLAQSEVTEPVTIGNPTGTPVKGQIMTFQIEQHGSTVRSITWGSKFIFTDDVNLDLTQTINAVDIFTAQYNANLDRWAVAGAAQNLPRA